MYQNTTFKLIPLKHNSKKPFRGFNKPNYNAPINTNQVAIAHLPSGTCSLDIDDYIQSSLFFKKHFSVDLKSLLESNPYINNGNQNKYKIIFKISTPLVSKVILENKKVIFELRCISKNGLTSIDTIPPSIHPDTGKQYQWIGDFHQIQEIPSWLTEYWQSLLIVKQVQQHDFNATYDEIWEAINYIDPNCSRQDWLHIAMAINHADSVLGENRGLAIFDKWSQGSTKLYNQTDTANTYHSISPDEKGIKIGTLFDMATKKGWHKKENVNGLFSPLNITEKKLIDPIAVLQRLRPPPPNLDLKLLPPVVRKIATELSSSIGSDPLVTVFSCLAVACGVIDTHIKLKITHGWRVKPILWLMTVGEVSDKKTPGSLPIFEVLQKITLEHRNKYASEKILWEGEKAKYEKQKKDYLKYCADPMNTGLSNDNMNQPPPDLRPKPEPLRITVEDVTSQRLVTLCAGNPRGVVCYMDEMASWVKKMALSNNNEDRSTWTRSYEGNSYERDRVVAGDTFAENLSVAIYGNLQPHVLQKHIYNLSEDGLLQRFVPAVLRDAFNGPGNPIPESQSFRSEWELIVRKLFSLKKHTYTLTPAAYDEFRKFQDWYGEFKETEKKYNQDGRIFMTAVGKLEGLVGRFALVFHLIETEFTPSISLNTMQRTITFIKEYVVPSYRYTYSEIGGTKEYIFDIWITNYIIRKSTKVIILSLSEIKRAGLRQFNQMEVTDNFKKDAVVRDAMALLESYGWVVPVDNKNIKWQIREELTQQFQSHRRELIENREKLLEKIINTSEQRKVK